MTRSAAKLLCLWLALLSVACAMQDAPTLIEVSGLSPRAIEPGDVIDVHGAGFPEGKAASVTLQGTLHRAGLPSLGSVRVTFPARGHSRNQLSFTAGPELEEALCVAELCTRHASFHGHAEVAFAPRVAGAPPVLGKLRDLTLEVFSTKLAASDTKQDHERSERLLALLGMTVEQRERELQVTSVLPRGRAAQAGVRADDSLVSANGVSVFGTSDLLPAEQERLLALRVKRGGSVVPGTLLVSVDGFSPLLPASFAWVFAIGLAVALWTVVSSLPLRAFAAASEPGSSLQRRMQERGTFSLVVLVGIAAAAWGMLAQRASVGLAVVLPLIAIAFLRPLLGFIAFGLEGRSGFRLRRASLGALKIQLAELAALLGLCPLLLAAGGLSPNELRAVQGPLPWQWSMFHSLPVVCAGLLFLMTTVYDVASGAAVARLAGRGRERALTRTDTVLVLVKVALCVPLFLAGGVPLTTLTAGSAGGWLVLALDACKYALLAWLVLRTRAWFEHPRLEEIARPLLVAFALVAFSTAFTLLPIAWERIALVAWMQRALPMALCVLAALGLIVASLRWRPQPHGATRGVAINPWL